MKHSYQVLILAAGMGRRLGPATAENTKCMVEVDGRRLIDRALDAVAELPRDGGCSIERIVLVIGYKGDNLKSHVGVEWKGIPVVYVENPVYDSTNNIYSLWLAREQFAQFDTLLLESDLLFEPKILRRLCADERPDLAVVDKFEPHMDGTVTILDEEQRIVDFIPKKEFSFKKAHKYYKTVNIYKLSGDFIRRYYLPFLDAYSIAFGNNEYYEQVLKVLVFLKEAGLKAMPLAGELWYEIDDLQDLDIAEALFAPPGERLDKMQRRYGGYWRFPGLKDFCYLVNPWFPGEDYIKEFKYSFEKLLRDYPSGQGVQSLLASNLFDCSPAQIAVGNGAAELIDRLTRHVEGTAALFFPAFNEYAARFGRERIVPVYPADREALRYDGAEALSALEKAEILLLVNPDNPSGNFIEEAELRALVRSAGEAGKRIVVDESFVDFAFPAKRFTLFETNYLAENPHLIVIKSISKSYGVPGLRLGVLASGDTALVEGLSRDLPVWNINSFGEFFLQTIGKHRAEYSRSCDRIAGERSRFSSRLAEGGLLEPMPSAANYLMCRISEKAAARGITARILAERLLEKGFFIKDLTGKEGIPRTDGGGYVRLAVRGGEDNDGLVRELEKLQALQASG